MLINNLKDHIMKKIILTLVFVTVLVNVLNAQVDKKAIGLHFGGLNGNGAEISYQQPLGANRAELDLGLHSGGFGLSGLYQWVKPLPQVSEGFYWYYGLGAGIGFYRFNVLSSSFNVGVLGQIGAEYDFEFPLQISIDYRPGIYFIPPVSPSYDGICLGIRYKF